MPAAADEVIGGEGIAVPDYDVDLAEAFDEGNLELLLEGGVSASIWVLIKFSSSSSSSDRQKKIKKITGTRQRI